MPGTQKFMHRIRGTYCFSFDKTNRCFAPSNVVSGMTRPETTTNIWISEAHLPQWIELTWNQPQTFNQICLTFDNNLDMSREKFAERGFAPELIKSYNISIEINGESSGNSFCLWELSKTKYSQF